MYPEKIVWLAMATVIGAVLFLGVFPTYHYASDSAREQEIHNVTEALSLYFAEHQRYPESLEIFFEQSLLQRSIQEHISYVPEHAYGSYWACYKDEQIHISYGPALSEVAHNVKLMRLQDRLIQYYREHAQFPRDLQELNLECPPGCREEISEGDYSYSASEDLQSFTLEGDTFGVPPARPSLKEWDRAEKIEYLAVTVDLFQLSYRKYPKGLEELVASDDLDADDLRDLLEGEGIVYTVSKDGKSAYLDGKDIESIIDAY